MQRLLKSKSSSISIMNFVHTFLPRKYSFGNQEFLILLHYDDVNIIHLRRWSVKKNKTFKMQKVT